MKYPKISEFDGSPQCPEGGCEECFLYLDDKVKVLKGGCIFAIWIGAKKDCIDHAKHEIIKCGIDIEGDCSCEGALGIVYNAQKQTLYYYDGAYRVGDVANDNIIPCQLIPIDREDLEPGDVAYITDPNKLTQTDNLYKYCLILDTPNDEYAHIVGGGVGVSGGCTGYDWYKVVPIEGEK